MVEGAPAWRPLTARLFLGSLAINQIILILKLAGDEPRVDIPGLIKTSITLEFSLIEARAFCHIAPKGILRPCL